MSFEKTKKSEALPLANPAEFRLNKSKRSPKRIRPSIKKDGVHPEIYNRLKLPWSCDDCCHFDRQQEACTLGYNAENHRKAFQKIQYDLSGQFALCRFQEID